MNVDRHRVYFFLDRLGAGGGAEIQHLLHEPPAFRFDHWHAELMRQLAGVFSGAVSVALVPSDRVPFGALDLTATLKNLEALA